MPYPVKNMIEDRGLPVSIHKDEPVHKAISLMIEHDFSQLPVVDADDRPLGMVTYESILRGIKNFKAKLDDLCVRDVIVKAWTYNLDEDLFELLDRLKETNAVLIVDQGYVLEGIVTSYDSTEYFRDRVEDLMRVEDIEVTIKEFIKVAFTNEQGEVDELHLQDVVSKSANPDKSSSQKPKTFDELSMGEYINLLAHKETWRVLEPILKFPKSNLLSLLDEIRKIRNILAHFRGEMSADQQDQLKFCASWLANCQENYQKERQKAYIAKLIAQNNTIDSSINKELLVEKSGQIVQPPFYSTNTNEFVLEQTGPKDSRYSPLIDWLLSQPGNINQIQLSFEDIEAIIESSLPASARQHRAWWANDKVGHIHSKQWLDAGWRTSFINLSEDRVTFVRIREREKAYIDFFGALLSNLHDKANFLFKNLNPNGASWIIIAGLPAKESPQASFGYSFSRDKRFRVELYIDTGDQVHNKQIYDLLLTQKKELESELGTISWERLDDKRASRIALYHFGEITDSTEELTALREWAVETMLKFHKAIAKRAEKALLETN